METQSEKAKRPKSPPSSEPIRFTPVTEGLGFHPFSDGLPYAPVSRTRTASHGADSSLSQNSAPMGSGAVAAGRPTFARSLPVQPQAKAPGASAQPAAPRVTVPVAPIAVSVASPMTAPPRVVTPAAQDTKKSEARVHPSGSALLVEDARPGFFYIMKRALAYLVDCALSMVAFVGLLFAWQAWDPNGLADILAPVTLLELTLAAFVFHWSLLGLTEVLFLTSFGKKVFGLRLQGARSAAFLRVFFFVPSLASLGIGILWGVFDRRKRCLHDHLVDAQPVEIARLS